MTFSFSHTLCTIASSATGSTAYGTNCSIVRSKRLYFETANTAHRPNLNARFAYESISQLMFSQVFPDYYSNIRMTIGAGCLPILVIF